MASLLATSTLLALYVTVTRPFARRWEQLASSLGYCLDALTWALMLALLGPGGAESGE